MLDPHALALFYQLSVQGCRNTDHLLFFRFFGLNKLKKNKQKVWLSTLISSSDELSSSDNAGGGVGARKLYEGFGFVRMTLTHVS